MIARWAALLVIAAVLSSVVALVWLRRSKETRAPVAAASAIRQRVPGEPAFDREQLLRAIDWDALTAEANEVGDVNEPGYAPEAASAGADFGAELALPAAETPSSSVPTASESTPAMQSMAEEEDEHTPTVLENEAADSELRSPALQVWTQTGLCAEQLEASEEIRRILKTRFNVRQDAELGTFFLDPRLPEDAHASVVALLDQAEAQVHSKLGLAPARPDVFIYKDAELLRAAACVNDAVIAYYDGALHVVVDDPDLARSVTHELAHHALISSDLRGPAWAQEGLAMHTAEERWWMRPARLAQMTKDPFPLVHMEEGIPYKLPKERSITFYTQAAAMVACVLVRKQIDLRGLVNILRDSIQTLRDVRELFEPEELEACVEFD